VEKELKHKLHDAQQENFTLSSRLLAANLCGECDSCAHLRTAVLGKKRQALLIKKKAKEAEDLLVSINVHLDSLDQEFRFGKDGSAFVVQPRWEKKIAVQSGRVYALFNQRAVPVTLSPSKHRAKRHKKPSPKVKTEQAFI
jgi:hypothetical protein